MGSSDWNLRKLIEIYYFGKVYYISSKLFKATVNNLIAKFVVEELKGQKVNDKEMITFILHLMEE